MRWICKNNIVTDNDINMVEEKLGIEFPRDFVTYIKQYDGGQPLPDAITVQGQEEVLNNLVSFVEGSVIYILKIISDTENLSGTGLVPIAEDPFGNLFCYSFGKEKAEIVFWDHEQGSNIKYVCNTFEDLISMLHEDEEDY